jgi:glycosyltransferase involved in cell wall biosynthesis
MKIAHVVVSLDPAAGGPPIVAARLAAAQARLGHDVRLISYRQPQATDRIEKMIAAAAGGELLKRDDLPPPSKLERIFAAQARHDLPQRFEGFDVIHLHGVWDPILKAAADAARTRGIRYVVAPHGMLDPWSLSQSRLKKRIALTLGYRAMLNGAAFLHLLNHDEADLIRPLGLTAQNVVIPNGIDPEEFADLPQAGAFRAVHPELRDDPYILFLSRLHYKKGLDHLAQSFAILARQQPVVRLVVAGPDDGARATFEDDIRASGLTDRVHIVGPLYGRDKYAAFRDAACFCLPSRQEGFSIAILESLACGTPVVISDACHFPEVAERGAGEVVTLDSTNIAKALQTVVSNNGTRERMSAAARAMVQHEYTWPAIAQQTITAYNRART